VSINRRTVIVVVVIALIVVVVYAVAGYQRMQKTRELIADLRSTNLEKAHDAMVDLREYGRSVAPQLIELLELRAPADRYAHVRAAMLLNDLGSKRAIPVLMTTMQRDPDTELDSRELRCASVSALASLGATEAIPEIIEIARDGSEDIELREMAVRALGVFEAPAAADLLLDILENRPPVPPEEEEEEEEAGDEEEVAADEPSEEGDEAAEGEEEEAVEEEVEEDTTERLRFYAARAVACILPDASKTIPVLARSIDPEVEISVSVRVAAASAFAWYDTPDSNAALRKAMEDEQPSVRCQAAWALGSHEKTSTEAVKILVEYQQDYHYHTRQAVADSLERLGQESKRKVKTTKI
jgi:HEAT repeat protein